MADTTDILLVGGAAALIGVALLSRRASAAPASSGGGISIPEWVKNLTKPTGPTTPPRVDSKGNVVPGKASISLTDMRADTREWIARDRSRLTDLGKVVDYLRTLHGYARKDGLAYNYYWPSAIFELASAGASQVILNTAQSIAKGMTPK